MEWRSGKYGEWKGWSSVVESVGSVGSGRAF